MTTFHNFALRIEIGWATRVVNPNWKLEMSLIELKPNKTSLGLKFHQTAFYIYFVIKYVHFWGYKVVRCQSDHYVTSNIGWISLRASIS